MYVNSQNSDSLHNQEQKPGKFLQSYYFLRLLSTLSKGQMRENLSTMDDKVNFYFLSKFLQYFLRTPFHAQFQF